MARSRVRAKVVGTYERPDAARRAAARAEEATAGRARSRPADQTDEVDSLRAEMREEIRHTIVGPGSVGPFTKEMAKGISALVPSLALAGALLALPFSLIEVGDAPFGLRVAIALVVGAVAGAVAGFVVGGGTRVHEKRGGDMAAERGRLVVIETDDPDALGKAAEAMTADAVRVDVFDFGEPIGEVATEEEERRPHAEERAADEAATKADVVRDRERRQGL